MNYGIVIMTMALRLLSLLDHTFDIKFISLFLAIVSFCFKGGGAILNFYEEHLETMLITCTTFISLLYGEVTLRIGM